MTISKGIQYEQIVQNSIGAIPDDLYPIPQKEAWIRRIKEVDWSKIIAEQKLFERIENQECIGFASLAQDTIDFLYVHPEYQGKGLATSLLEEVESYARQQGQKTLCIKASLSLFPLCIKQGFAVLEKEKVMIDAVVLERFSMQKPLHHIRQKSAVLFKSERLFLREMLPIDAASFFALNADWEVMKYTGDIVFESVASSCKFLENYDPYSKTGFGRWTLIRKSDGHTLGWCGIKKKADGSIDLGYRLHRKYWNQGYATEASRLCLDLAKNKFQLHQLVLEANKENGASRAVAEKLGFRFDKYVLNDGVEDAIYFKDL